MEFNKLYPWPEEVLAIAGTLEVTVLLHAFIVFGDNDNEFHPSTTNLLNLKELSFNYILYIISSLVEPKCLHNTSKVTRVLNEDSTE